MVRKTLALAVVLTLTGIIGCGGSNAVEGIVTLDGNPVSDASVTFFPKDGKGQTGTGRTDSSGRFTVNAAKQKGLPSGTYKVVVVKTKSTIEGGSPEAMAGGDKKGAMGGDYFKMMEKNMGGKGKGGPGGPPMPGPPSSAEVKSELPQKYADEKTTPFEVKVPLESRPVKLELTSK